MKHPDYPDLLKAGLKRKLTATEEVQLAQYFAEHPELQAAWEEDVGLNRALGQLPNAPVSSNFTAQVLRRVERECPPARRAHPARGWFRLLPPTWARKLALTAALFAVGFISYHQHVNSRREEVARAAATLSTFAALPTLEILENFEAIQRLEQVPPRVDIELVAALR